MSRVSQNCGRLRAANWAAAGAWVVELSSAGHRLSDIRWDDPDFNTEYDGMLAYGEAKTANVMFAAAGRQHQHVRGDQPAAQGAAAPQPSGA